MKMSERFIRDEVRNLEATIETVETINIQRSYSIDDLSYMEGTAEVRLLFDGIEQIPGLNVLHGFAARFGCLDSLWVIELNPRLSEKECCDQVRLVIKGQIERRIGVLEAKLTNEKDIEKANKELASQ